MDDFTPPGDGLGPLADQGDNRNRGSLPGLIGNGLVQQDLAAFHNGGAADVVHQGPYAYGVLASQIASILAN